jgi:hypothetical protein
LGTFTWDEGDGLVFGASTFNTGYDQTDIRYLKFALSTGLGANDAPRMKMEYYDGTNWVEMPYSKYFSRDPNMADFEETPPTVSSMEEHFSFISTVKPLSDTIVDEDCHIFQFTPPGNWAQTELSSTTAYWVRIINTGSVTGTDLVLYTTPTTALKPNFYRSFLDRSLSQTAFSLQFPFGQRYVFMGGRNDDTSIGSATTAMQGHHDVRYYTTFNQKGISKWHQNRDLSADDTSPTALGDYKQNEPGTLGMVPTFGEAFIAYNHSVFRIKDTYDLGPTARPDLIEGLIETSEAIVGTGGAYDKASVPQLDSYPRAKYTTFFQGRLWACGIEEEVHTVKWSAATPYHKVWPLSASEPLMEDDTSPITGMSALGEHLIVFKRNSIWKMVGTGVDAFGVARYTPVKVISGIGCCSNASIQQVRGELVFLSDEGLYSFDGLSIRRVTERSRHDRLRTFMNTVKRNNKAVAMHWQTKNAYMLACTTGASKDGEGNQVNDSILVWDYVHDAFWIWNGWEVANWLRTVTPGDEEEIYFLDHEGVLNKIAGTHDYYTAISSYVVTQRMGYKQNLTFTARQVEITANNTMDTATVEILPNGADSGDSGALDFKDINEAKFEVAQFEVDSFAVKRLRARRMNFRVIGDYIQVKVSNNTLNDEFQIRQIETAFQPKGKR